MHFGGSGPPITCLVRQSSEEKVLAKVILRERSEAGIGASSPGVTYGKSYRSGALLERIVDRN